jgi:peptidoglycan/xylan/chitin deacetylase (PgdA/CDA1 family)
MMGRVVSVVVESIRPQYFVTFFAAALCLFAVPTQVYFAAQLDGLQTFVVPASHKSTPVIVPPRVLGASSLPTPPNCRQVACIALTFDDGPNQATTSQILDILDQQNVSATFFIVGKHVPGNEALLRRMQAQGDEIGNHSWSHSNFTKLTPDQIRHEVSDTQNIITAAGVPVPRLFRPPYGAVNDTVRNNVPLRIAMWNEDSRDWDSHNVAKVQEALITSARPGGVIDAHDIYQSTADALGPTITELKARQFTFVTMSQLMNNDDPGSGHDFYGFKDRTAPPR